MNWRAILLATLLLLARTAHADLPQAALNQAVADPPPGARFALSLKAPDLSGQTRSLREALDGHPGFVLFADYTCKMLCGPALVLLGTALERENLPAGSYRIVVIGLDPKDSADDARRMRDTEMPEPLRANATFLLPDAASVTAAAQAVGFRYVYDASVDQFAHPEVVYAVAADGTVLHLLSPFALTTVDMKSALITPQTPPSLYERIRTICYRFGVLSGPYTGTIETALMASAVLTLLAMAGAFLLMLRRRTS